MFNKPFEGRMSFWRDFRNTLEDSSDPIADAVEFYRLAPMVSFQADPYDQKTWPDPWELLKDNLYCPFVKLLAICYTLQLTERFTGSNFQIHITQDKQLSQEKYLLKIDDMYIGYNDDQVIVINDLPESLLVETVYDMPSL